MTKEMFDAARERGNTSKIGQLNPMGRYGVPQGMYVVQTLLPRADHARRNCADGAFLGIR